jgi:hypothetical protein
MFVKEFHWNSGPSSGYTTLRSFVTSEEALKHLFLLAVGLCLLEVASAAPVCVDGTLASYEALGSTGCTIGGNTLASFTTVSGTTGATEIDPTLVTIDPLGGTANPSLTFLVDQSASAGMLFETIFDYVISGPAYTAESITLSASSETVDGAVTDLQNFCADGLFGPDGVTGCPGSPGSLLTLDGVQNMDQTAFANPHLLNITDDFTVDGGTAGTASGGTFVDQFTVPEPATWLLTAAGFLLVGRRKLKRNK